MAISARPPKVRITKGRGARIEIDGKPIHGVFEYAVSQSARNGQVLTLHIHADVEIVGEPQRSTCPAGIEHDVRDDCRCRQGDPYWIAAGGAVVRGYTPKNSGNDSVPPQGGSGLVR